MIMKTKLLVVPLVMFIFIAVPLGLFIYLFGPIDTFPRKFERVQCSDSSLSVTVYRKKLRWFDFETDVFVRVSDNQGRIVHEEKLFNFDMWQDLQVTGEAPKGFCNQAMWKKNARAEFHRQDKRKWL